MYFCDSGLTHIHSLPIGSVAFCISLMDSCGTEVWPPTSNSEQSFVMHSSHSMQKNPDLESINIRGDGYAGRNSVNFNARMRH